ncbi:MAG: TIGR00725 family protein [Candidatus Heimdallarchaeota archaeon]|nr:TIGR00725 family protein [Candidatus Heimdallarchaeota archaeon]MBY8994081.1 TIGR00725 family protein [Candidatus Heimdallarchaeota archaeon]
MGRRKIISIIGGSAQTSLEKDNAIAFEIGVLLVDNGYRILCGGYGGVMEAVCKGARSSSKYQEGDTIGIISTLDSNDANEYCDIVIATGIHYARNQIITASGDGVVAIGGGSGTLSEIAFAWQLGKPIFSYKKTGWSGKLSEMQLDNKRSDTIIGYDTAQQLIEKLNALF